MNYLKKSIAKGKSPSNGTINYEHSIQTVILDDGGLTDGRYTVFIPNKTAELYTVFKVRGNGIYRYHDVTTRPGLFSSMPHSAEHISYHACPEKVQQSIIAIQNMVHSRYRAEGVQLWH